MQYFIHNLLKTGADSSPCERRVSLLFKPCPSSKVRVAQVGPVPKSHFCCTLAPHWGNGLVDGLQALLDAGLVGGGYFVFKGVHGCLDSRFSPPWQAAAGFGGSSLEVLIHGLDLLPAVAAAHPAGVAMGVSGYKVEDRQQAKTLASEVLWRAGHWGVSGG